MTPTLHIRRALLALGLLGASCAFTGTANAAVPGLHLVSATTANDSAFNKGLNAICPFHEQALGAGAFLGGAIGQVKITSVTPFDFGPGVRGFGSANGSEDQDGTAANWNITTIAVCALPVPGYEYVEAVTDTSQSPPSRTVTVSCPSGKRVLGAGGGTFGDGIIPDDVVLEAITPSAGLTSVQARAHEDQDGSPDAWGVFATATCANPVAGLELVTKTTPSTSVAKAINATCPSGKRVLGAGGDLTGGAGEVQMDDLTMQAGLTNVLVTGIEDQDATSANWTARAHAICATP